MASRKSKPRGTRYHHYILREDEHPGGLLALQTPYGKGKRAHFDEHLFIITHQAFELWFNQIIEDLLREGTGAIARIEAGAWGPAAKQVRRLTKIARLLSDQYGIMGTLSPSDFLVFRDMLTPSSGYDSAQFRALELSSGLRGDGAYLRHVTGLDADREGGPAELARKVDQVLEALEEGRPSPLKDYSIVLKLAGQGDTNGLRSIRRSLGNPSLRDAAYGAIMEADVPEPPWPKGAVAKWERARASEWEAGRKEAIAAHGSYEVGLDGARAAKIQSRVVSLYHSVTNGDARSAKAWALLDLLEALIEYDEAFRNLRAIHINMVLRVIGGKPGTGGSTGARYLRSTLGYEFFPLLWRARDHMEGPVSP